MTKIGFQNYSMLNYVPFKHTSFQAMDNNLQWDYIK